MSGPNAILTMARSEAERNAIDLLSYASTVFPQELHDLASAKILEVGVQFAVNARRCFEVDGHPQTIQARRWNYQLNAEKRAETDLWKALNGVIHARKLRIHFSESPQDIFVNSKNSFALHFNLRN